MLSKASLKFILSLHQKKYRKSNGLFIAEGEKVVQELLLSTFLIHSIYATNSWLNENQIKLKQFPSITYIINELELNKISQLSTPNQVIAIAHLPLTEINIDEIKNNLVIVLDEINDPGNLGTIIRIADWFGVKAIVCSRSTVDAFNNKTVQSAMGSIFKVPVIYTDLKKWLLPYKLETGNNLYATVLKGKNIYDEKMPEKGAIIIGSESHGISNEVLQMADIKITIPSFSSQVNGAESLNAAVAAGIVLSQFRSHR